MLLKSLQQLSFDNESDKKTSLLDYLINYSQSHPLPTLTHTSEESLHDPLDLPAHPILVHLSIQEDDKIQLTLFKKIKGEGIPVEWELHDRSYLQNIPFLKNFLFYGPEYIYLSVPAPLLADFLLTLCVHKMLFIDKSTFTPVQYQEEFFWQFFVTLSSNGKIWGEFRNLEKSIDLWDATYISPEGLMINLTENTIGQLENLHSLPIIKFLLANGVQKINPSDLGKFCYYFSIISTNYNFTFKYSCTLSVEVAKCTPVIYLKSPTGNKEPKHMDASVWFLYTNKEFISTKVQSWPLCIPIHYKYQDQQDQQFLLFETRDLQKEEDLENFIENYPMVEYNARTHYYKIPLRDILETINNLLDQGWTVWAQGKKVSKINKMDFDIEESDSGFFDVVFDFSGIKLNAAELIKILKSKNFFIPLSETGLGVLPKKWLEHFVSLFHLFSAKNSDNEFKGFSNIFASTIINTIETLGEPHRSYFEFEKLSLFKNLHEQTLSPSTNIIIQLREYQLFGFNWLFQLYSQNLGGILADDMGLGKTAQVICFLDKIIDSSKKLPPNLIVAPKSLLFQWEREILKFAPHLRVKVITKGELYSLHDLTHLYDIFIVNYHFLRIHIEIFKQLRFECIFYDEAQFVKNDFSQSYQAIIQLQSKCRFCLTGTPIENKITDLTNLFSIINPGLLHTHQLSQEQLNSSDYQNLLFACMRPFVLRRLKKDVLQELPEKTYMVLELEISGTQKEEYFNLQKIYQAKLEQVLEEGTFLQHKLYFLEGILRLRQICDHPGLFNKNLVLEEESAKLRHFFSHLDGILADQHKIVIFSQFIPFLTHLKNGFDMRKISYCYLDGKTENREKIVQEFQNDSNIQIFLISLKAGGFGINLTSADYCFIMDPWWNKAIEDQAIDRIYRLGQYKSVFIYKYILQNTIEEKMHSLALKKGNLLEKIYGLKENEDFLKDFNEEDFKDFFS